MASDGNDLEGVFTLVLLVDGIIATFVIGTFWHWLPIFALLAMINCSR